MVDTEAGLNSDEAQFHKLVQPIEAELKALIEKLFSTTQGPGDLYLRANFCECKLREIAEYAACATAFDEKNLKRLRQNMKKMRDYSDNEGRAMYKEFQNGPKRNKT